MADPLADALKDIDIKDSETERLIIGLDFGTTYSG